MRPIFSGRKTRLVYAGAGAVALAIPATAVALTAGPLSTPSSAGGGPRSSGADTVAATRTPHVTGASGAPKPTVRTAAQRGCGQLFTVNMGEGAANLIYSDTSTVTEHDVQVLGYIERCQRNPAAQGFVRGYDQHQAQLHAARIAAAEAAAAAQAAQSQQPQLSTEAEGQSSQSQSQSQSQLQQAAGTSGQAAVQPSTSDVSGGGLEGCIIQHESGGNPQATTGEYEGLGQWSPEAWAEDGGTQYAPSPLGASAAQQEAVLNSEGAAGMQQQQGQYDGC